METKLTASLAIITALLLHRPFATVANNATSASLTTSSPAGFSLKLVRHHEDSGHTIRRGSDGFLYLHRSLSGASPAANLTTLLPAVVHDATTLIFGTGAGTRMLQVAVIRAGHVVPALWVQCLPCRECARQAGLMFNAEMSPTFRYVSGRNPMCRPPLRNEPRRDLCVWQLTGGPRGFFAAGSLGVDYVAHINDHAPSKTDFGCSHLTRNFNNDNIYAGSMYVRPFMEQVAADGITNFSDCLAAGETNRQGFLRFGADVPRNPEYRTTRILPALDAQEPGYYLSLVGVSLGARRLDGIHPETFARREDGQGGCVIDRGTPVTVMVREAYRVVEEAVWSDLERHGAQRVKLTAPGYGLCIRATESIKGRLQPLSLHFAGEDATLVVTPQQIFVMTEDKEAGRVACLAMVPGHRTIIGALQQVDTRFVYDVKHSMLSFAPESCAKDTVQVV